jgi:hypothetical protein
MTISQRRASTVYDRFNFTIIDFTELSAPSSVEYHPDDFFPFYDVIFSIDQNQTDWEQSNQFMFLYTIAAFLESTTDNQINTGEGTRQLRLCEFLATPIAIYSNAFRRLPTGNNMGKSLAIAIPSYRVGPTNLR